MRSFACTLVSGSSGNATFVSDGTTHLLIDAGLSFARLKRALGEFSLCPEELAAVLITHEHSDHIAGLATLLSRTKVPVYASAGTARALLSRLPELAPRLFGFFAGSAFVLPGAEIFSFSTPHDSADSVGYTVRFDGWRASVVTDLGYVPQEVRDAVSGSDYVLMEANHDPALLRNGPYPIHLKRRILGRNGHLANEDCAELACALVAQGARHVALGHLSAENNRPELAYEAVAGRLLGQGLTEGYRLEVAPRSERGQVFLP